MVGATIDSSLFIVTLLCTVPLGDGNQTHLENQLLATTQGRGVERECEGLDI